LLHRFREGRFNLGLGTKLTPPRRRRMSAFKGEAVISLDQSLVSE
jgi:hypothetical protein